MVNDVIAEHRTIEQSETRNLDALAYLLRIRWLLYILAVVSMDGSRFSQGYHYSRLLLA
jgi:hypothetical protein